LILIYDNETLGVVDRRGRGGSTLGDSRPTALKTAYMTQPRDHAVRVKRARRERWTSACWRVQHVEYGSLTPRLLPCAWPVRAISDAENLGLRGTRSGALGLPTAAPRPVTRSARGLDREPARGLRRCCSRVFLRLPVSANILHRPGKSARSPGLFARSVEIAEFGVMVCLPGFLNTGGQT